MLSDILDSFRYEPGIVQICLRLLCALVVGIVIGTEREYTNRPAGMRTHVLVALGACTVSLTGQMLFSEYSAMGAAPDPARLAAQVITGVGFLGAGTILREGANVKGLTTAASLWTVACLGIASGFGYYPIALCGMLFMLFTLTLLEFFQHRLPGRNTLCQDYRLECQDIVQALDLLHAQEKEHHAQLRNILAQRTGTSHTVTFTAEFPGIGSKHRQAKFFAALSAAPGTLQVEEGRKETV